MMAHALLPIEEHIAPVASAEPSAPNVHDRRHKAIVALDVVGFCRRVERDEAAALSDLDFLHESIIGPLARKWLGRVVDTAGDGSVLDFDRVDDAVAFAIELQRGLAESFQSNSEGALVLRAG